MEAKGGYDSLAKYTKIANNKYKKEIDAYAASVKAVADARVEVKKMLTETPGIKEFFSDPKIFKMVWLRGFAKFEGIPTKEQFEDKLKVNKNNKFTPFLKKAVSYLEKTKEADRLAFNEKFKKVLKLSGEWVAAGKVLDAKMLELE